MIAAVATSEDRSCHFTEAGSLPTGAKWFTADSPRRSLVCTENLMRVDDVMESPKLAE
jgi:hypothetical protein